MKKEFKISIITCIYKIEDYLEEAINSIINQDIGFEENVQLILVNDGSPDNSEEICLKYQKMYPENIFYIKKKNGGLSSAKNEGLKHIKGRYVNFFDGDDTLPSNTLREVYNFFDKNDRYIDIVALPLYFFEAQTGLHVKYKKMGHKNRIINLIKEPYNFVISSASCFYKKEIFDSFRFDESYLGEEDTELNFKIYGNNPKLGYVCENGVKYNYRKRADQSSISDTAKENYRAYLTVVKLLDSIIPDTNNLNRLYQEIIIYELRSRIKTISTDIFPTKEEYDQVFSKIKKYLKKLSADYIIHDSEYCNSLEMKYTLLEKGEFDMSLFNEYVLNSNTITIREIKCVNEYLQVDAFFNNFGMDFLDIVCLNGNSIIEPSESKDFNSALDLTYGNTIVDKTHLRRFKIKLRKAKKINFIFRNSDNNRYYPAASIKMGNRTPLNSVSPVFFEKNYRILFTGHRIKVSKLSKPRLVYLKRKIVSILKIYKNQKIFTPIRLLSHINKKYILISDRLTKAGDNGEALFKYINTYRKDLAKKTYYVISKESEDYHRMKQYGKVVATGSFKHKRLFLNAAYIYSSHTMPEYFNAFKISNLQLYRDLFNYKFVWLQHGITQNDISKAANRYLKKIDYIISCTNDEYKEFCENKYCFDKDQILLTGFARYDYLKNEPQNIITLAPTWRRGYGSSTPRTDFTSSRYYKEFKDILQNDKLLEHLRKKGIILKFILHPEMLSYIEDFTPFENDVVKIIPAGEINYSQIFAESKLFITDYSSTFFDFAYLKKPEIFFQFDQEEYFSSHYKKGYFNFEKDAFGPVYEKSEDVINKIVEYVNNDFKMEDAYVKRVEKTFSFIDKNNSKRIIDATYKED